MKPFQALSTSFLVALAFATQASAQQYSGEQGPLGVDTGSRIYDTARDGDAESRSNVIIREGDMSYATLLYGYNSDDAQQAPIFATLHDYGDTGGPSYLDGMRLQGVLKLSRESAVIEFTRAIPKNRPAFPISAIAVSPNLDRVGVAGRVNRHVIERYSSLFIGGLLQGAGQAGQLLLDGGNKSGTTIIIGDNSNVQSDNSDLSDAEKVAIASLLPIGDNLASAAQQGFNRPPTVSAPAGFGMGVVFLEPITWEDIK